jgi:protein-S-isoprenylcysteine O-methyltransferase Ste14
LSIGLLAFAIAVTAVALLHARREYRQCGRLSVVGLFLLCAMIFVPNLALEYATRYRFPDTLLDYTGIAMGIVGIAICLVAIRNFRSVSKVFCLDSGELATAGPYRWSRNPQYVGFFLFLVGFALTDWSLACLPPLLVQAINLHLLVLVEEEHLQREFGDPYLEFCRTTPRYFGWARPRA